MTVVLKTTDNLDIQFAEDVELMVISKLTAIYSRIKLDAKCDVRRVRNTDKWWLRLLKIFLCEYDTAYDRALVNRLYLVKETKGIYEDFTRTQIQGMVKWRLVQELEETLSKKKQLIFKKVVREVFKGKSVKDVYKNGLLL